MDKICFNRHCLSHSDGLRAGWSLRDGGYAMLCDQCASAYEEGSFCNIFHLDASGWRPCITCNKDVHGGCIMSIRLYSEADCGGVKCTQCMANDVTLGVMWCNISPQTLQNLKDPSDIILYTDLSNVTGSTQGVPSQEDDDASLPDTHFQNPGDKEESQVQKNVRKQDCCVFKTMVNLLLSLDGVEASLLVFDGSLI